MKMSALPADSWTLTARWVFPMDGEPLPGGTITIQGECIFSVSPHGDRAADLDLGNAAILPGLVNAHTHLDLSGLRGRCPPGADFPAWLMAIGRHRRETTPEQVDNAIRAGLAESIRFGTTLLGDIAAGGASWPILANAPIRAIVFRELIGPTEERAERAYAEAVAWLESHPATACCRPGLSPHAPYTVRASLFRRVAALHPSQPVAIHLAETREELELLAHKRGPFVSFLSELGVWDKEGLIGGIGDLLTLFEGPTPRLFVHGNYLGPNDLIPAGSAVVYCPRTHAAFGHDRHPLPRLLAAGVNVALGTDSLASNPDLDLLAEARWVREHFPELPDSIILSLATLNGARALGLEELTGSLTSGKSADLVVLSLPDEDRPNPFDLVLRSTAPVRGVLCRGRWLAGPS
jgi:cytosine/adenosine deaminase-related metal-dependent hydrolase